MLPTAKWKLRQTLRKNYEEQIACLKENLKIQRQMAGEFIDVKNYEALSSVHLMIEQENQEIEKIEAKLDLLNDDSCFEKAYYEQTQTSDEDDR